MSDSPALGIHIEELQSLAHPIDCISRGTGGIPGLTIGGIPAVRSVNVFHYFPMQGNLIWGSRTSDQDTQWQYVDVRRMAFFLEQSLSQQLQWAVFENNGPSLWQSVSNSIDNFLTNEWVSGHLHGKKRHEAFFVKCDSTTMTQNDLDNGRLVIIVGFAPVHPAEFVLLQITVQTQKK